MFRNKIRDKRKPRGGLISRALQKEMNVTEEENKYAKLENKKMNTGF